MSVYPQSHAYGQVAYPPPQGYGQPRGPMPGMYQYPPAPPPVPPPFYHVDPNTFRRDYSAKLAELTVNSRPIIQSLSMIAQEYSRWAGIVVQCIEAHIRRVPPWMKLPAFYVLDAISKNVFDPYARTFTPIVIQLFLESYEQVDQSTRSKMDEMLLTWRTGAPNGKELFGVGPQVAIERGIWGGSSSGTPGAPAAFSPGPDPISKPQVLSELEFTLGQKQRALQLNPYDSASQNQVNALRQLRSLVDAGVSQDELRQILGQLRAMVRDSAPPPPPPAPVVQAIVAPMTSYQSSIPPPSDPFGSSLAASAGPSNFAASVAAFGAPQPTVAGSVATSGPAPALPTNLSSLFSALVKAGIVSNTSPNAGGNATAHADDVKPEVKPEVADPERVAAREYRKAVLSHAVKLTTADISKQRPAVAQLLYDRLALQCRQCGVRFPEGPRGKRKLDDHLDMHFRQNRKASQNIGRGHSRSWFIGIDDWIRDVPVEMKGKGRADGVRRMNARDTAIEEAARRDAELRAMRVVVPAGDEAKPIRCPICKESLKSEFLEDEEEWVWKNAVMKDGKIYHATCHAEALVSSTTLATRLRNEESTSRSRSGTPDVAALRSTPPKQVSAVEALRKSESPTAEAGRSGTKRKAENEWSPFHGAEPDHASASTPPAKKVAASA